MDIVALHKRAGPLDGPLVDSLDFRVAHVAAQQLALRVLIKRTTGKVMLDGVAS